MITQKEMLAHFLHILEKSGKRYKKKSLVRAKKAQPGLEVVTKTSDGDETKNTAEAGDWLVENQTSSNELYLVKAETFQKKYSLIQSLEKGWGCYQPKGEILGLIVSEKHLEGLDATNVLEFQAPWKDTMVVKPGDMLVVPPEKDEIYRIAKKEFGETYVEI
ncbi:hypothetical protein SAMN04489724_1357 [Algoriphagus locisalis]|uniref:Uncharacterized protein n=1 Tax=Algoriphagus locisalis TaxID=305507 RepID=A0A1I6Z105_9BACT|nr:hypothetical protein [Algoriphagus locisalis]SFT56440.1 hypothetical protein SAMN04489724_1357 [Algoriphagus locisalis]